MDWIHCNMCFVQPRDLNSNFVLTSCGHIFCRMCENREVVNECKICKIACSITKLSGEMLPNVKEYFEEPIELLDRALRACRFQKGHRMNLLRAYSRNGEKYQKAKAHIQKLEVHIQKMETHINKLERKLECYEKRTISPISTSEPFHFTPVINHETSESHFFNSSIQNGNSASTKSNPLTPSKHPAFSSQMNAYRQYRHNELIRTPASEPPAKGTPPRSGDYKFVPINNSITSVSHQSKFPIRTPPYSALNNLKITGSRGSTN